MLDYLKNGILPELLAQFTNAVPKFLVALVIFFIGWIVAKVVAKVISNLFGKIGVDKVGEQLNEIDFIRNSNIKVKISAIFSKIVYYTLLLFFLVAAVDSHRRESRYGQCDLYGEGGLFSHRGCSGLRLLCNGVQDAG